MKFDILHNFISPITGRVLANRDYMLIGDRADIATPSPLFMDTKIDIQNLQHAIKNIPIEVTGAIDLKGKLSSFSLENPNILTSTFTPNPVFTGDSLHLPYGPTADRPAEPKEGMFRYNDEQDFLEYFNGSIWASLTSSVQPINISKEFATDMVYGVIGNVNGLFDGFASLERDLDIKIKSSYYTGELNDSSSASLSLLDRYNNGYINKTISSNTGYFDYLLQKQDDGIKTDLLKFDNKIDEFIFHKPISHNGKNIIKYDEAVDIVTGVLNNSNGLFSGFATDNQEIDIKIKTAHFAEDDYSSSSLSFLNRYNNGYIFSNKTNSNWSNDFSFNSINNEIKTELFKYDSLSDKFLFNKLVEVPYPINDEDAANKYYVDNAAAGVKEVLGTTGQIFSSGGQYPQISLAETGVSARSYTLLSGSVDEFGRITNASDGQAVTQVSTGYGLTGGIITDTGTIELSSSGVSTGTYTNANITVDYAGRILSASNSNSIENVTFYGNTISSNSWNGHIVIDPNYTGGNGDIYLNADTKIENGSYLRLYDNSNVKYTEIRSPDFYSQPSTWKLPITEGQPDQFIKMGYNNQLEWTTIATDAGVTRIDTGYGLYGGPIYDVGTISLSSTGVYPGTYTNPTLTIDGAGRIMSASNGQSSNLGNFQFSGDTMYTSGGSGQMNISNVIVNFAGGISTGGGVGMSGFGSSGFIWVASDGSLQYTGPNGTTKLAN
jgi:hypothetical protein